jgi:PhnB protein
MTISPLTTSLQPRLVVSDAGAAIEFYTAALGATELIRFTDDAGATVHAELTIGGAGFYLKDADRHDRDPISLGGTPVLLSLRVPTTAAVDATVDAAVQRGASVIFPVADRDYGERDGRIADPFGHVWLIGSPLSPTGSVRGT